MSNKGVGSIDYFRKKVTKTYEFISTSYHEAGHTVYGLLNYMNIESIIVYEDKKLKRICGFTYYDSPKLDSIECDELLSNRVHAEIGLSYAGLVAEKRQFALASGSNKFPLFLKDGSSDDTIEASNIMRKYQVAPPGRKRYEFKKKMIREVGTQLQEHWDAVTIIAHALFRKKQLSTAEVKDLLIKKSKNKKFWKNQFKMIESIYLEDGSSVFPQSIIN
jgi:hypothetical protein